MLLLLSLRLPCACSFGGADASAGGSAGGRGCGWPCLLDDQGGGGESGWTCLFKILGREVFTLETGKSGTLGTLGP